MKILTKKGYTHNAQKRSEIKEEVLKKLAET